MSWVIHNLGTKTLPSVENSEGSELYLPEREKPDIRGRWSYLYSPSSKTWVTIQKCKFCDWVELQNLQTFMVFEENSKPDGEDEKFLTNKSQRPHLGFTDRRDRRFFENPPRASKSLPNLIKPS